MNKTNLLLDSVIFLAFLVATVPDLSGAAIHEWLGIALAAAVCGPSGIALELDC